MFTDDFVMIDSDGSRQSLDDVTGWATTEDFHIGDFDIIHDMIVVAAYYSATLDGRYSMVVFVENRAISLED